MPDVGPVLLRLPCESRLTDEELGRAIRFMMAAEFEAIHLELRITQSAGKVLAVDALKSVNREDRAHIGAFLKRVLEPVPDEEVFDARRAKKFQIRGSWMMESLCRATCAP